MISDFRGDAIFLLGFLGVFLLILAVGCMVADYIFPKILPLRRYLDSLPEYEDDEEIAKRCETIRRMKARERHQ